ncbi:uncharacterized protein LOC119186751 isoform X2 [Rhipicephalus microplus]|uniref:uncharacterized protein LOC119186751 isoform X2 n=1 Tax=Rhipicephalus microplus TaxID=6941 RepID=UPI003F6BBAF8
MDSDSDPRREYQRGLYTTAVMVNKNTTTKTISDDMTPTTSPATTMLSTTKSPSDPVTKAAGGAEATTKNVAARPVVENTTEYTTKRTSVLTTTTARPVKQVATVQTTTKLPSTQITTTSSTTAGPTVQVTLSISVEATMKTNTERPSTSVTKAANETAKSTNSTTEAPFTKMTTNITKRPAILATTPKSTTERPVTQVTTLKSTTPHPDTQVTPVQTTTKLPSTQLTTIRSTTGLPSVQGNKTAVSEAGTMITHTSSPSVTVTSAATNQATTTHTSTARPSVQLTTMKSTSHVASTQATKKEGITDHLSVPVTKTTSGSLSSTKETTERPSTQGTTMNSATERPSVQVATTTSTTMSPSISVTKAVGGNVAPAKSTTERPSMPVTKPVSSEAPTMKSTTERPNVQVAAVVGGSHITTTSTTQRPSTHVTKVVTDDTTTSTTTTESSVIVDVILVTSPKPTASTKPPSHNLGDIVQEAVVVPQGSPVAEGGVDVVIEVVPILNGNETSGQDSVGLDTHSTFKPSSETTMKPKKMHSGLKKQFTNSYMQTYVTKRCGVPNERMRRIVGGKVTTLERYPWTVGIWMRYGQRPYCGGVIISWLFVLTAGHCTRNKVAHDLRVSFGLSEIDPDRVKSEQQEHLIAVAAIHQNPLFKDIVHGDDISILKMSKPLQSGGYPVTPICIPEATETKITTEDIVGTEGVVAGWGRTKYGGESSKQLREVWLPIVSNNACSAIFKDILKIRDEMICAGDINGTKDACQGDSGGSLMWRSKSDDRWYTLGVVSFGVKCAEPGYYGTYTRVQSYLDWICQVTDGLLCFGSSSYKGVTLPTKDMREKQLRERRSRNLSKM